MARASRLCDPVSDAELERRRNAAQERMRAGGIDALVIQGHQEFMGGYLRWFTDIPATHGYPRSLIVPAEGLMTVAEVSYFGAETDLDGADPEYRGIGRRVGTASFTATVAYTGSYDAELIAREIRRSGFRTVGLVCAAGMYHGFVSGLKEMLKDVNWVDATELVDRLKAVKSPEEIELIYRTAAMQDEVMDKVLEYVKPGLVESEVSAYARYIADGLGSTQGSYLCSSAPLGRPARYMHRYQQSRRLEKGDVFLFLVENSGPAGFFSHVSALMVLGKAPQELRDAFELSLEAHRNTLGLLKPGASCAEIFAQHNDFMRKHGLPAEKRIHCHGQGQEMVERPLIRHDETMSIQEHMHLAVHPGVGNERLYANCTECYIIGPDGPIPGMHRTKQQIFELS